MTRRSTDEFVSSRQKVTPDDLEEDVAIVTVAAVDEVLVDDRDAPDGKRKALTLLFEETGDKVMWLNKTMIGYLIDRFGDDDEEWVGQQLPIEKHLSQYGKTTYNKVWISAPESWDELFTEAGVSKPRRKVTATAKKGKKR